MKFYAVIMAGGVGSRFWPRSKKKLPKQLLQIFGDNTMIQATVNRLSGLVEKENIYVITNELQRPEVINQLKDVPEENIIEEPFGRNTAACIGLASVIIKAKDPNAITFVLPADHIIKDVEKFKLTLENAAKFANESKGLVTIGIEPTRPETGYGYIQINDKPITENIYKVLTFAEKPNYATAVRFVDSGDFLWNSGMFIWRCDVILDEIKNLMPDLHEGLIAIEKSLTSPNFSQRDGFPKEELKELAIIYEKKGLSEKTAITVAQELTDHDPVMAHLDAELN
ncbi:MAG: sugar phosphate nucleotidyltransferase, partial [Ignavibacteriota bacterium]